MIFRTVRLNRLRQTCLLICFGVLALTGCQSDAVSHEPGTAQAKGDNAPDLNKLVGVPSQDLDELLQQLKSDGVPKVAQQLRSSADLGNQYLGKSLEQLALPLNEDPHQLWFQLQARSRYPGMEAYRTWLEKQRPAHTMMSLTSLPMLPPCVQRSAQTDTRVQNLRVSRDGKTLWVATNRTVEAIDLESWSLIPERYEIYSYFDRKPVYADASPFDPKRENTKIDLASARRMGTNAQTVFVDGVRFLGRRDIAEWMVNSIEGRYLEIISAWEDESGNERRILAKVQGLPKVVSYKRDTMQTSYEKALPEEVTYFAIDKDRIYGAHGKRLLVFDLQGRPIVEGDAAAADITVAIPYGSSKQTLVGDQYGMVHLVNLDELVVLPQPLPDEVACSVPKGLRSPELSRRLWKQSTKDGYRVIDSTNGTTHVDVTWPSQLAGKVESVGCGEPFQTLILWADHQLMRFDVASKNSEPITLDPPPSGPFASSTTGHVSPDGSRLVLMEQMQRSKPRRIQIYDTATGKLVNQHELSGFIVASKTEFVSDATMVALTVPTADRAKTGEVLVVFDLKEGKKTHEFMVGMEAADFFVDGFHHRLFVSPKVVDKLEKNESGHNVLTYSWPLVMYDLKTGEKTILRQQSSHATLLGVFSSGKRLLTFCDGSVHVANLDDPQQSESYRLSPIKRPFPSAPLPKQLRVRSDNQRFFQIIREIVGMDMVYVGDSS